MPAAGGRHTAVPFPVQLAHKQTAPPTLPPSVLLVAPAALAVLAVARGCRQQPCDIVGADVAASVAAPEVAPRAAVEAPAHAAESQRLEEG
mmetsp:Transcript_48142/g.111503  ORF Transcript_48142/g.111503 Transcript_48142/m.111503 type:complete len:91 (+) Transcript_48142:155-427(+)